MALLIPLLISGLLVGCSTLDEDTLRDQSVRLGASLSEDQLARLRRFAANRFAQGRLSGKRGTIKIGTIECYADEDDAKPAVKYDFLVEDMIDCLLKKSTSTYFTCADEFIRDRLAEFKASNPVGEYPTCGHDEADIKWTPSFDPDEDPYYNENNHDLSDVLRIIIGLHEPLPPEIEAILMAMAAMGRMGVLCPLGIDGCPDNPTEPGTWQDPGEPANGGDR